MEPRKRVFGGVAFTGDQPLFPAAVGYGDLLFLSGQAPIDPATSTVCASGFREQATFVLQAIAQTLALAGREMSDVLRVECILSDPNDFAVWNELYAATFSPPRPARTTFVAQFVVSGMLLEIQATARSRSVDSEPTLQPSTEATLGDKA